MRGNVIHIYFYRLSHEAFNESNGLFVTTSEQLLYPNPNSYATKRKYKVINKHCKYILYSFFYV
jgi:hypothetical protein